MSVSGWRIPAAAGPGWRPATVARDRSSRMASQPSSRSASASDTTVALPALATTRNRSSAEPVHDQVVDDPAILGADHRVLGPADRQGAVGPTRAQRRGHRRPPAIDEEFAHVRQVEQAGPFADRPMLVEDPAVLDRHQPATELDELGVERPMDVGQRGLAKHRVVLGQGVVDSVWGGDVDGLPATFADGRGSRCGATNERPLRLEGQQDGGLLERHPADPFELVVVEREIATDRLHQEVVDGLVDPDPVLDEHVGNRGQRFDDPDLQAGLLLDLAERRLLDGLAGIGSALGKGPGGRRRSPSRWRSPITSAGRPAMVERRSRRRKWRLRTSGEPRRRRGARSAVPDGSSPRHRHRRTRPARGRNA